MRVCARFDVSTRVKKRVVFFRSFFFCFVQRGACAHSWQACAGTNFYHDVHKEMNYAWECRIWSCHNRTAWNNAMQPGYLDPKTSWFHLPSKRIYKKQGLSFFIRARFLIVFCAIFFCLHMNVDET